MVHWLERNHVNTKRAEEERRERGERWKANARGESKEFLMEAIKRISRSCCCLWFDATFSGWKRAGGNERDQREKSQKKGEEKRRRRRSLFWSSSLVCVCGGHQKSGHANRGESEWRFHIPLPPSLEVTARHCKHERIFPLLLFLLLFLFLFHFFFFFSSPGTRRVDVRIGRP